MLNLRFSASGQETVGGLRQLDRFHSRVGNKDVAADDKVRPVMVSARASFSLLSGLRILALVIKRRKAQLRHPKAPLSNQRIECATLRELFRVSLGNVCSGRCHLWTPH